MDVKYRFQIKTLIFCISGLLFNSQESNSQLLHEQNHFKAITIDEGLSNNRTTGITKCKNGFIWVATDDGVCRFDGLKIKHYNIESGNNDDIYNQQISNIYADNNGNLFIGALQLMKYNYLTDKIEMVFDSSVTNQPLRIRALQHEKNNKIWVGARNGFYSLNTKTFELEEYPADKDGTKYEIWDILKSKNKVWLGSRKNGLIVYDLITKKYKKIPLYNEDNEPVNIILCLFLDDKGILWAGTKNNGIFKVDTSDYSVVAQEIPGAGNRRIRKIIKDADNNIWIGTLEGLYVLYNGEKPFVRYAHIYHEISKISHNSVFNIYIDDNENMWLCTYAGGINYTNLRHKKFTSISAQKGNDNYLNNHIVCGFGEDNSGNLYVGTDHGGLNILNRSSGKFAYIEHGPGKISGTNIKCILNGKNDDLWIGTYEGGVNYYNPKTNVIKYFNEKSNSNNSLQSNIIYSLIFDNQDNILVGSDQGVDRIYKDSHQIERIHTYEGSHYLFRDSKGIVWLGIDGIGIYIYDEISNQFKKCLDNYNIPGARAFYRDKNNNLWLGAKDGISVINLVDSSYYSYKKEDGLPSNIVFTIFSDDNANLWASTSAGIVKLINAVNAPNSFDINIFTKKDGLQSNQFWRNSGYKSKTGELFFGGVNGFSFFQPDSIKVNPYKPKLAFTGIKINNKDIKVNQEAFGSIFLNQSLNTIKKVKLLPNHKILTIEFIALHFDNPEKNGYKYMMYPFEEDWNYAEAPRNFATYTSLPAGKYEFRVKACNSDGIWSDETIRIEFVIIPPFWQTWIFWIAISLILITFTLIYLNRRVHRYKKQKLILEKLVEERTGEILKKNKELEEGQNKIIKQSETLQKQKEELIEVNSIKDKFLSIIAHDLRNPFQAVMGFSELLLRDFEKMTDEKKIKFIELIDKSSNRIYDLLENLLTWSRTHTNKIKVYPEKIDINELVGQNIKLLEEKCSKKKVNIISNLPRSLTAFADKNMINSVFNNLLTNAIKFSYSDSLIEINYMYDETQVIVLIKDYGVGIEPTEKEQLFNLQRSLTTTGTDGEDGTGFGLLLCKEFVVKNGGTIWVESEPELGSSFYFSIPIAKTK